jgi:hypothetical protein
MNFIYIYDYKENDSHCQLVMRNIFEKCIINLTFKEKPLMEENA